MRKTETANLPWVSQVIFNSDLSDRRNPSERLGNLKNGITDIKKHRYIKKGNRDILLVDVSGLVNYRILTLIGQYECG